MFIVVEIEPNLVTISFCKITTPMFPMSLVLFDDWKIGLDKPSLPSNFPHHKIGGLINTQVLDAILLKGRTQTQIQQLRGTFVKSLIQSIDKEMFA